MHCNQRVSSETSRGSADHHAPTAPLVHPPAATPDPSTPVNMFSSEEMFGMAFLVEMGVTRDKVLQALLDSNWNIGMAADKLADVECWEQNVDIVECPVCLEGKSNPVELACSHRLCRD